MCILGSPIISPASFFIIIIIIIIIIIKKQQHWPKWENKVVYKLLSQPQKHLRHGKLKITRLMETMHP